VQKFKINNQLCGIDAKKNILQPSCGSGSATIDAAFADCHNYIIQKKMNVKTMIPGVRWRM
jgi:hypothetical protein